MRDEKLINQIKAREELEARGWVSKNCPYCDGVGFSMGQCIPIPCRYCDGCGHIWTPPMTKTAE